MKSGLTRRADTCVWRAGYADAERKPYEFPITPADAIPRALAKAGVKASDVDYYEINEAFSVVGLVNMKVLPLFVYVSAFHGSVCFE